MAVTVAGTQITFNDGTTQSTAGGLSTNLYDIGSFVVGRPRNTANYAVNSTVAGSSLSTSACNQTFDFAGNPSQASPATLINVGSWRCVSPTYYDAGAGYGGMGLWVRYA